MTIDDLDEVIGKLENLRGAHDQTMRCGAIKAAYGTKKVKGRTPTERFLEDQIVWAKETRRRLVTDLMDEE